MDGDKINLHRKPENKKLKWKRALKDNSISSVHEISQGKNVKNITNSIDFEKCLYENSEYNKQNLRPKPEKNSHIKCTEDYRSCNKKKRVRKNYVEFQNLNTTLSPQNMGRKPKELLIEPYRDVFQKDRWSVAKEVPVKRKLSDIISEISDSKARSSDVFGFQRSNRQRRNFDYNTNVIYKLLGGESKSNNIPHETITCNAYSFEKSGDELKKSSSAKTENEAPTRYSLINFTQGKTTTDTYMLKPKRSGKLQLNVKDSVSSWSKRVKNKCLLKKVKSTSAPCSGKTAVVNVCQPIKMKRKVSKHVRDVHKRNTCYKPRTFIKISLEPSLSLFKSILKHFLTIFAIIVWIPCVLIIGILWLLSYPFRPTDFWENATRNFLNRKYPTRKSKSKRKMPIFNNAYRLYSRSLPKLLSGSITRKTRSKISLQFHNESIKCTKHGSFSCEKLKRGESKTKVCFYRSNVTALAFPSERSKCRKSRKSRKNVKFKKCCDQFLSQENTSRLYNNKESSLKIENPHNLKLGIGDTESFSMKGQTYETQVKCKDYEIKQPSKQKLGSFRYSTPQPKLHQKAQLKRKSAIDISCTQISDDEHCRKTNVECKKRRNKKKDRNRSCSSCSSIDSSPSPCHSVPQKFSSSSTRRKASDKKAKGLLGKTSSILKCTPSFQTQHNCEESSICFPADCMEVRQPCPGIKYGSPPCYANPCSKNKKAKKKTDTKGDVVLKEKKAKKPEPKKKPTAVLKFFPAPRRKMRSVHSTINLPHPPEPRKRRQIFRSTSINTIPIKTTSVLKFLKTNVECKKRRNKKKDRNRSCSTCSSIGSSPSPCHSVPQKFSSSSSRRKASDKKAKGLLGKTSSILKCTSSFQTQCNCEESSICIPPGCMEVRQPCPRLKYGSPPRYAKPCTKNKKAKKKTDTKGDVVLKEKKSKKPEPKKKPTAVLKFFPAPRRKMRSVHSTINLPHPPEPRKRRQIFRSASINTIPMKTTSVLKFFPAPRSRNENVSSNTETPKTSSLLKTLKSLRRTSASKGVTTAPLKITSVIKFFPPPTVSNMKKDTESPSINEPSEKKKPKEPVSAPVPAKQTTVIKFFPTPRDAKCSSRTNGQPKFTSVIKFFPPPLCFTRNSASNTTESQIPGTSARLKRAKASNTDLLKSTKVFKFFPPPRHQTRTHACNVDIKREQPQLKEKTCKTVQVIKYFPAPSPMTRTSAADAQPMKGTGKNKYRSTSVGTLRNMMKSTSIIKFFPQPRPHTRTSTTSTRNRTRSKQGTAKFTTKIIKYFPRRKKRKNIPAQKSPRKCKDNKKIKSERDGQIVSVRKYYLRKNKEIVPTAPCKVIIPPCLHPIPPCMNTVAPCQRKGATRKKDVTAAKTFTQSSICDRTTRGYGSRDDKPKLKRTPLIQLLPARRIRTCSSSANTSCHRMGSFKSRRTQSAFPLPLLIVNKNKIGAKTSQKPRKPDLKVAKALHFKEKLFKDAHPKGPKDKHCKHLKNKYSKKVCKKNIPIKRMITRFGKAKKIIMNFFVTIDRNPVTCEDILNRPGKKPCPFIHKWCPSVYPAFLVLYKLYKNLIRIFFFMFAICIWCPLLCCCFFLYSIIKRSFCS